MAKRTAVIDIGTNSMRLVIFEKTSRFAFHIIGEYKSPVKLGEDSYQNGGILSDAAMDRAFYALGEFVEIAKAHACRKTFCIATSALRSAPNKSVFISRVKQKLKTTITVIDGKREATLGAIAALNLLDIQNGITMDIGGGSCELARIENSQITDTFSLDLGTIRLRERAPLDNVEQAYTFVAEQLNTLPSSFKTDTLIAIGGSSRAIAKYVQKKNNYPLKVLHGYRYNLAQNSSYIDAISTMDEPTLRKYFKERVDTIREGAFIAREVQKHLEVKEILISGAGVRDGVYLSDLLRTSGKRFPLNFNVSVKSLQDRFISDTKREQQTPKNTLRLFEVLQPLHKLASHYMYPLQIAAKLLHLGSKLDFYKEDSNGFYFIQNALHYGFSHEEKILIAFLIRFRGRKLDSKLYQKFELLLPPMETLEHLLATLALGECLVQVPFQHTTYALEDDILYIDATHSYLAKECITRCHIPYPIIFKGNHA